jgi:hypothetical protein
VTQVFVDYSTLYGAVAEIDKTKIEHTRTHTYAHASPSYVCCPRWLPPREGIDSSVGVKGQAPGAVSGCEVVGGVVVGDQVIDHALPCHCVAHTSRLDTTPTSSPCHAQHHTLSTKDRDWEGVEGVEGVGGGGCGGGGCGGWRWREARTQYLALHRKRWNPDLIPGLR